MIQALAAYALVAAAAGWALWSFFLKGALRRRAAPKGGCGPDCGCGD
jgi:hypothetical protein